MLRRATALKRICDRQRVQNAFNRIKILFIPLFYLIKMPQIKNTSQFVALIH